MIAAFVALLTWVIPSGKYDTLTYNKSDNTFIINCRGTTTLIPANKKSLDQLNIKIPLENFTNGDSVANYKDAPLAAVSGIVFGKIGITLIIMTTVISILGCLGGEILSVTRVLFASARDGLFPKRLAAIHPRFSTPHIAIIFYAAFGLLFAIFGGFKQLAILASTSSLINYLAVVLATLKLRKTDASTPENSFRVPGDILVPILAAIAIVWLLSNLTKEELISFFVFIAIFSFLYFIIKMFRKTT